MGTPHGPCRPLTHVNQVCVADTRVLDPGVEASSPQAPAPTHQHVREHEGGQQPAVHHCVPDQHVQPFGLCEAGHVQHHGTWGRWVMRSGHGQFRSAPPWHPPGPGPPPLGKSPQTSQGRDAVGAREGGRQDTGRSSRAHPHARPRAPGPTGTGPQEWETGDHRGPTEGLRVPFSHFW